MPIKLAPYNIRKAVGLDWKRDPLRIERVMEEVAADVFILQEADKRLAPRPSVLSAARLLETQNLAPVPFCEQQVSHGWHGNALFYKSHLTLVEHNSLTLPGWEPRGFVSAIFETPTQAKFMVIGGHLGLTPGKRRAQIQHIKGYVEERSGGLPVIFGGDFNEWRASKVIATGFGEGFKVITPGHSFHAAKPKIALDHFVVSQTLTPREAFVHKTESSLRASDHLPISIEVDLSSPKIA